MVHAPGTSSGCSLIVDHRSQWAVFLNHWGFLIVYVQMRARGKQKSSSEIVEGGMEFGEELLEELALQRKLQKTE